MASVLILVVVEDVLVHRSGLTFRLMGMVLILVVVEDVLVLAKVMVDNHQEES